MKGKINLKSNKNIFVSLLLILAVLVSPVTSLFKYIGKVFASNSTISDVNGETLSLRNFNNSVKFDHFYNLPGFRFGGTDYNYADRESLPNGWKVKYSVISPLGKVVDITQENGSYGFYAKVKGVYRLTVQTVKDGVVSTEIKNLRIDVVDAEVSISYPTNSEFVIPNKVPAGASVLMPAPVINNPDEIDLTGYSLEVKVKAKDQDFDDVTALTVKTQGEKQYYEYVPASDASNGIYEVRYQYKNGENVVSTINRTFEYTSDSEFIDDMKLEFTLNSAMIQTAVAGVTSTLPSAKIVDANANSEDEVSAYLNIVIKYHDVSTDKYINVTNEVLDGFKFTPTRLGNYYVTYQAMIPYSQMKDGLTDVTSGEPKSYVIRDVVDNQDPEILFTKGYEVSEDKTTITSVDGVDVPSTQTLEDTLESLGDMTGLIPSVAVMDEVVDSKSVAVFELPAMFAKDNFSKNFNDFTFTRQIKGGSYTGYVDIPSTDGVYGVNETATFTAKTAGTYYVKYTVKDNAGNEVYKTFTIKVISQDTFNEDYSENKPEITMSELANSIKSSDVIEFTFSATDKYDERLNNLVEVTATASVGTFDNSTTTKTIDSTSKYFKIDGTKYTFDFASFVADNQPNDESELVVSNLKVKAISRNDYNNEASTVEKQVTVINTNDSDPVQISLYDDSHTFNYYLEELNDLSESLENDGLSASDKALFVQKQTIKLPDFKFLEVGSASVKFDLSVYDKKGNSLPVAYEFEPDSEYTGTDHQFVLKNTSFVASYSGMYTITYKITDAGNNITCKTYAIQVKDTERPSILIVDETNLNTTIELGTSVKIPVAGLIDDGENVDLGATNASTNVTISSNGSQYFDYATYTFTPEKTGEYVIKYTGKDASDNDATPIEYTITVKDTVSPVISLSQEVDLTKAWDDEAGQVEVEVPYATVSDINLDLNNDSQTFAKITVTNAKGTKQTLLDRENGNNYFVAESQGEYTITYTATDAENNTTTLTRKIAVGNCYQPTLQFINDYSIPTSLKVGDPFTLTLDDEFVLITDKDGSDEEITKTVTLTDPSGKVIDSPTNSWTFSEAGDYKLKITLSDGVTEAKVYTYTIKVTDKEVSESSKVSATVGTILIVVSILALGAVVVYFVITNKKGSVKKAKFQKNNK